MAGKSEVTPSNPPCFWVLSTCLLVLFGSRLLPSTLLDVAHVTEGRPRGAGGWEMC
jgi:hypothetical protein